MGALHGHEIKVEYHPSFVGTPNRTTGETDWHDYYTLDFKASIMLKAKKGFSSEAYRRAFVEAMERIAKLED